MMDSNSITRRKSWDGVKLEFDMEKNSYSLSFPELSINNSVVKAEIENGKFSDFKWSFEEEDDERIVFSTQNALGEWLLVFSGIKNNSGVQGVSIELSVDLPSDFEKLIIKPLSVDEFATDHLLVHGRRMGACKAYKFPVEEETDFESSFQTVLTVNNCSLQIANPLLQDQLSFVSGRIKGSSIKCLTASSVVSPAVKQKVNAAAVQLFASEKGHSLMIDWAKDNVEEEKEFGAPKRGWNSWDYYRWTITEDEVLKNAEFIASDPVLSKHVKRIIVDDGWQYCYGEWDANPLFPSGMKALADKLNGMGFEPGLWFAPTIIEPHCRIAQVESDMLAMGKSGLPCLAYECMRRFGFVLDPTREKVQKWLFDLFSRYTDMGYKYFKLDFLWQTLKAYKFHDQSVPKGNIMRRIVEPIYKAADGKAAILGCNYQFEGGTAFVDDVRISGDIHATWNAVRNNVFSVGSRFWSDGILWRNDPDFALCRGPETSNDPEMENLKPSLVCVTPDAPASPETEIYGKCIVDITMEETKILLSIALLSGGAVNLSDNMLRLNEKGLDLARKTVSAAPGKAALPLDLFKVERPSYWLQELFDGGARVLLINWMDEEDELIFDLEKHGISLSSASDFWTGEDVELDNGKLKKILKPHSCLLAEFKR